MAHGSTVMVQPLALTPKALLAQKLSTLPVINRLKRAGHFKQQLYH